MQAMEQFHKSDAPFLAEKMLGNSSLAEKNLCAAGEYGSIWASRSAPTCRRTRTRNWWTR